MSENKVQTANLKFEEALAKLENVLQQLERSDCPRRSAGAFSGRHAVGAICRSKLNDVEIKSLSS